MKLLSRVLLAALVLVLASCEDPLDRVQGEPGEDNNYFTGEVPNDETMDQGEAAGEGTQPGAGEGYSEGEAAGDEQGEGDAGEP